MWADFVQLVNDNNTKITLNPLALLQRNKMRYGYRCFFLIKGI